MQGVVVMVVGDRPQFTAGLDRVAGQEQDQEGGKTKVENERFHRFGSLAKGLLVFYMRRAAAEKTPPELSLPDRAERALQ
jgi:hypothetical protein